MRVAAALLVGILFGFGVTLSGMINPANIIAFLDVTGSWNPSLLVVTASALAVSFIGYRLAFALQKPVLDTSFQNPAKTVIDRPLILGAAIFGIGWGLSGLCPGPAITAAALMRLEVLAFLAAMLAGMALKDFAPAGRAA